jgi:hypothetical protein
MMSIGRRDIDAQPRLHQAQAEYAAYCRNPPWSVEPLEGWPGTVHPHTGEVTGGRFMDKSCRNP